MTLNTTYSPTVADGNGVTTSFSYSFNPLSVNYLKVSLEISGVWVQQLTGWTATVSPNGGIVTFTTAPTTRVCIERVIPEEQPTDYKTSAGFQAEVIEHSFDMLTGMVQQVQEKLDRALTSEIGSQLSPELVAAEVERIYNSIDNVDAVADDLLNVNSVAGDLTNVDAVAGDLTNIDSVASNKTNIDKVANNIANVNAVATDITDVSNVAADLTNINAVASDLTNIDAVAGDLTKINGVQADLTNIDSVASNLTNINAVAGNATNINNVNANKTNIDKVANKITEVGTVAGSINNVNTVSNSINNVNTVASNGTNINTVAGISSDVSTLASIAGNVSSVAGNTTNINNVAADLTNIDAVAADLTNINSASTYANNAKKWAEGADGEVTPLGGTHSAKGWAEIAEQAASGVQNPANRDLSNLSNNGEYRFDTQNETISNCVLEIPQNVSVELSGNTLTVKKGSVLTKTGTTYETFTLNNDISREFSLNANTRYYLFVNNNGVSFSWFKVTETISADTLPANGTPYRNVFLSTDRKIYRWSSNTWNEQNVSYPFCIIGVDASSNIYIEKDADSNDLIFNGAGFIGHHAFILPNIKYLIPQGYQDNKKMLSAEISKSGVSVIELTGTAPAGYDRIIYGNASGAVALCSYNEVNKLNQLDGSSYYSYVAEENRIYQASGTPQNNRCPLVYFSVQNDVVTRFKVKKPIRTVTNEVLNNALSVKGNTFKIYQPTLSHSRFGHFWLFVFPDGHNVLYDCAYTGEENDIDTFLASLNITHLDVVIISHFHEDHAGCAPHIINNYCDSATLFYKCMDADYSQFTTDEITGAKDYEDAYKSALSAKGYVYTIPTNKSSVTLFNGSVELTFYNTDTSNLSTYYSPEMKEGSNSNCNNMSMCVLIRAYGTSIFMSGDIQYSGEKAIADYVPQNVDILQVPHHGVNKNGYYKFYDRLNAKVAVFQKNDITTDQEKKYICRYIHYTNNIPLINNANATGIELECYNGNVKFLNGKFIDFMGETNDYDIQHILPAPRDTTHNAGNYANWTIADVVDMLKYGVNENIRVGNTFDTTTLISELNSLISSTSWILTPHIEYIEIQKRTDISVAPKRAKSSSDHS